MLALVVIATAITGELFIRPFDPWAAFHHILSAELISGFLVGLIILVVSLVGSFVYDRFFCKYLCPMGAFLGLINRIGIYRIRRNNDSCTHCMACNRACPTDVRVESMDQVQSAECINCNLCVAACPVADTLVIAAPRAKKRIPPLAVTIATAAVFAAAVGASSVIGAVEWSIKPLEKVVDAGKALDPADIKGTDTFAEVSRLSGIPKEEFIAEFKLTDKDFVSPIRDVAHAEGAAFDTQAVRDFVASRIGGRWRRPPQRHTCFVQQARHLPDETMLL